MYNGRMTNANTRSKTCFKCQMEFPRSEFYKHSAMGDGLLGKCKECTKRDAIEHRLANLDRVRAYDRARSKNPERMRYAAEISNLWRQADKRRMASHNAVARAIKAGKLVRQPCCICGSEKSLAHHESYDRPLDVVFYCQPHHKARHKEMAIAGIEP